MASLPNEDDNGENNEESESRSSLSLFLHLPTDLFSLCFTASRSAAAFAPPARRRYTVRRLGERESVSVSVCGSESDSESESAYDNSCEGFLTLQDWVRLDIALTNRRLRAVYLANLRGVRIDYPTHTDTNTQRDTLTHTLSLTHTHTHAHTRTFTLRDWPGFSQWLYTRSLTLTSLTLTPHVLSHLAHTTPLALAQLTAQVSTLRCTTNVSKEHAHTLSLLLQRCPSLTAVYIHNNTRITAPTVRALLQNSPRLVSLSLAACKHVNDAALRKIERHTFTSTTAVKREGDSAQDNNNNSKNKIANKHTNTNKNMNKNIKTHTKSTYDSSVNDNTYNTSKGLLSLDLSKCVFSTESLLSLLHALPRLYALDLSFCRFSLRRLALALAPPSLSLSHTRTHSSPHISLPQLQELHLRYVKHDEGEGRDTTDGGTREALHTLIQALTTRPALVALSLDGAHTLTDDQVLSVVCACPRLRYLSLESCAAISLANLSMSLPHTQAQHTHQHTLVHTTTQRESYAGMRTRPLSQLQALDLRNCFALTDEAVVSLSRCLSRCVDVAVDGCFRLTERAIVALRDAPRERRSLHPPRVSFSHCPHVDASVLRESIL